MGSVSVAGDGKAVSERLREWDEADLRRLGFDREFADSPEILEFLLETQPPIEAYEARHPSRIDTRSEESTA